MSLLGIPLQTDSTNPISANRLSKTNSLSLTFFQLLLQIRFRFPFGDAERFPFFTLDQFADINDLPDVTGIMRHLPFNGFQHCMGLTTDRKSTRLNSSH